MKANIIYALGILALLGYGIYSWFAYDDLEQEQAYFIIPFALAIGVVFYLSTRPRRGK